MKKIIVLIVVVILIVVAGIRLMAVREGNIKQNENLNAEFVSVSVADVKNMEGSFELNFTGVLYPNQELDVPAEVSGKITSLKYSLGQSISKGGLIATLDDKLKQIAYDNAKIETGRLKRELDRIQNLYNGGTSSVKELDQITTQYETAKNKLDEAEKQLSYTKITAPISGIITKKIAEEGSYVNPGTPIVSLVDISKLKVKINVSESNIYNLKIGDRVKITTDVYSGIEFGGRISFISPRGDDSHNYQVEVEIGNQSKNPLKAGTFVNVTVNISKQGSSLFIPRESLQGSIKDAKVYIVENGKAVLRSILVGRENNEMLEVKSGLKEGDKVVLSGQVNLTNNKPIKIIN